MNTINISKRKLSELKKLKLDKKIINTEGIIYILDYRSIKLIFKCLYDTNSKNIANKLYTVEMLDHYKDYLPKGFWIPDRLVTVGGKISGFASPELPGVNLKIILDSKEVSASEKIYYLSKIGEILNQLKQIRKYSPLKSIYINDLHEANIIVDTNKKETSIVDLDSSKILQNACFPSKFLNPNEFLTSKENKYNYNQDTDNGTGYIIANENSDIYCYIIMILNFLTKTRIDKLNIEEFYKYLNYLDYLGYDKELLECFNKIALKCDNENPYLYLETITENQIYRANEKVYKLHHINHS